MPTYLVTGGCGFIGSHLVDALCASGAKVLILDDLSTGRTENVSSAAEVISGCITDGSTVRAAMTGVDGCFHLAAIASVQRAQEDWLGCHKVNQTGSLTVFDAARSANAGRKVPVVYASSAAVYGRVTSLPIAEDAELRPISAYGADKLGSELHARVAGTSHGVPTCGLRFFNVYGPRQRPDSPYSGVISIFRKRIVDGSPVRVFGDGEQTRDFVHVSDVVRALTMAMKSARTDSPVFNVCRGVAVSVNALISELAALAPRSVPSVVYEATREGEIRHSQGSPTRAAQELGFRAQVSIREGLQDLVSRPDAVG